LLAALLSVTVYSIPLSASGQSAPSKSTAGGLLPRNYVVTQLLVSQFFPEIDREASTGKNATAVGSPEATRAVFFTNGDGSKLVTVTVDRYRTAKDAAAAYQEAVDKSRAVPGFSPVSLLLNVGQQAFAGTASVGDETHVGLGALNGKLIVGVTLAGFEPTPENFIDLVGLARAEDAASTAATIRF
jgi:hypothetical protein